MQKVGSTATSAERGRTLAQWYCLLVGPALVLAGIAGFLVDSTFGAGHDVDGDSLIFFEVNGWHNIVHLASGLFLLAAARRRKRAKDAALLFGAVYGLVTLVGLIDGNEVFALVPVNGPDHALHALLSLLGLVAGVPSTGTERTVAIEQRRSASWR